MNLTEHEMDELKASVMQQDVERVIAFMDKKISEIPPTIVAVQAEPPAVSDDEMDDASDESEETETPKAAKHGKSKKP